MRKLLLLTLVACITTIASADFATYQEAIQDGRKNVLAGRYVDARKSFLAAQALAKSPKDEADALIKVGKTHEEEGSYAKAREAWQKVFAMSEAPTEQKLQAQFVIGGSYQREGNNIKARELLQQIVIAPGVSPELKSMAYASIGGSYLAEKRFPEARAELSKIVSDPKTDTATLNLVRFTMAGSYQDEGKFDLARQGLLNLLEDPKVDSALRFLSEKQLGDNYFKQGKFADARTEYIKATQIAGVEVLQLADVQVRVVLAYMGEGKDKEAKATQTQYQTAWLTQANALMQAFKYAESRSRYQAALLLVSDATSPVVIARSRIKIADSYIGQSSPELARKELQLAADVLTQAEEKNWDSKTSNDLQVTRQMGQHSLAFTYVLEGDKDGAIKEFERLLQMPNLNPQTRIAAEKDLANLKIAKAKAAA